MLRRRGTVYGDSEFDQVIEVGLDELLGIDDEGHDEGGDEGTEDDRDLVTDAGVRDDDAGPDEYDDWREDEPDLAGASFGAAFFGWLVASGTVVLLLALVSGVCSLIGWDELADWPASGAGAGWLLVGAWFVLVLSMGIGAFAGGYASARMVPSHGGRQGLDAWLFSWCAAGVIAGLAYLVDRKYDLVARIDWQSLPIAESDRTPAALVALVAIMLVTLVSSVLGGASADRSRGVTADGHLRPVR